MQIKKFDKGVGGGIYLYIQIRFFKKKEDPQNVDASYHHSRLIVSKINIFPGKYNAILC